MTRDIVANIQENDLILANGRDAILTCYDVVWGKVFDDDAENILYANVIVPVKKLNQITFKDSQFFCYVNIPYHPYNKPFRIRFIYENGNGYGLVETDVPQELFAYIYGFDNSAPERLNASELILLNLAGYYIIRIDDIEDENFRKAIIYSADATDFEIGFSDDQAAKLLAVCGPGNYYRYPTLGVGITNYINGVISHTDLGHRLTEQFQKNNMPIQSADFDAETGNLNTLFSNEQDPDPDTNILSLVNLDKSFFSKANDDFIRQMQIAVQNGDDNNFLDGMEDYGYAGGIYFFPSSVTGYTRLEDSFSQGVILPDGSIDENGDGYIVQARLWTGSVIIFNLPDFNYDTNPAFTLTDMNRNLFYRDIVGKKYGLRNDNLKCAIVNRNCILKYGISREDFQNRSYGIFLMLKTDDNYKSLLGVAIDHITGRIICMTAPGSYIADAMLDNTLKAGMTENDLTNSVIILKTNTDNGE